MAADSSFTFMPLGALIQEFKVDGQNIVLGFPEGEPYATAPYFGETIGRVANRIKDGTIENLNGKSLKLAQNGGRNHLHGGRKGWGKQNFTGPQPVNRNGKESVLFTYVSPDGEEGYPGTVEIRVWYSASEENEAGVKKTVLVAEYEVEFTGTECEETVVNVTNHSYFNLSGSDTTEGTECTLSTTKYLPVDEHSIPRGTIDDCTTVQANTPFVLGKDDPTFDHCFTMDTNAANIPLDTRSRDPAKLVAFYHPGSKIHLDIYSTEPAFQFYTGQFVDVPASHGMPARGARSGFCIEPSRYINAINEPEWRSQVLLKQGSVWGAKTVYKAWKA